MSRQRTFPPYPKRAHKTGQARIKIDRRDHYLGTFASPESWAEYERLLAEWRRHNTAGTTRNIPAIPIGTIEELAGMFWDHVEDHYRHADGSPTSEVSSWELTLRPLLRIHGKTCLKEFGPLALKEVRSVMIDGSWLTSDEIQRRQARGLRFTVCRRSTNQRISRIKSMFKWGVENELIEHGVYARLCTVRGLQQGRTNAKEHPPVEPVADDVIEETLPLLSPPVDSMVQLQRFTGMRPGEIVGLTPEQIDRTSLSVDGIRVWIYRPKKHKTAWRGKRKAILIGPQAQEVLLPFLNGNPDKPCFRPTRSKKGQYTRDTYRQAIERACEKGGIAMWTPNQLRHTAATAINSEFGLDDAQAVLGHSDSATTKIYAAQLERAARIVAQVG